MINHQCSAQDNHCSNFAKTQYHKAQILQKSIILKFVYEKHSLENYYSFITIPIQVQLMRHLISFFRFLPNIHIMI